MVEGRVLVGNSCVLLPRSSWLIIIWYIFSFRCQIGHTHWAFRFYLIGVAAVTASRLSPLYSESGHWVRIRFTISSRSSCASTWGHVGGRKWHKYASKLLTSPPRPARNELWKLIKITQKGEGAAGRQHSVPLSPVCISNEPHWNRRYISGQELRLLAIIATEF